MMKWIPVGGNTQAAQVPGGLLFKTFETDQLGPLAVALCFVPTSSPQDAEAWLAQNMPK